MIPFPDWLHTFARVQDSAQALKRHILTLLFIRVCLFTLLCTIPLIFRSTGHELILASQSTTLVFLLVLVAFSVGSGIILQKKQRSIRRFGLIQLLADIVFTSLLVFGSGCSQSIFTPLFIFPIIAGGLILYKIGGLIPAAAATLAYGGILGLEYFRLTPDYFVHTAYEPLTDPYAASNLFAAYGVTFFVIAIISGQLAGRLRKAEKELSQTVLEYDRLSLLYKQIFDDISTGIITTDDHNIITSYNNAAERITGYPPATVVGRPLRQVFPQISYIGDRERNVCDLEREDGKRIRVGYSFSRLGMPAATDITDQKAHWKVVTLQDISKIEMMERQVREAEKMAAIGELSASVAHDFRNPLAAISGSAQILAMEEQEDKDTVKSLVGIILRESQRMAKTITDFLQFARPEAAAPKWFDLNRLISEVIETTIPLYEQLEQQRFAKHIEVHLHCWGDRQQVQTILTHLLENTRSIPGIDEPVQVVVNAYESTRDGKNVTCIEVCDTGPGISESLQEQVFEPFFSTREDGTGLGLAIVKQLVDNHNGQLEIDRNDRYGCIIRLFLPYPELVTP